MFCHVTRALQGVIIQSVSIAKHFIARTVTDTGLRVVAEIARRQYRKGKTASEDFIGEMSVRFNSFLPKLNYTVYNSQ